MWVYVASEVPDQVDEPAKSWSSIEVKDLGEKGFGIDARPENALDM